MKRKKPQLYSIVLSLCMTMLLGHCQAIELSHCEFGDVLTVLGREFYDMSNIKLASAVMPVTYDGVESMEERLLVGGKLEQGSQDTSEKISFLAYYDLTNCRSIFRVMDQDYTLDDDSMAVAIDTEKDIVY